MNKVRFKKTADGWLDTQTELEWSKTLGEASWEDAQLLIPEGWRLPTIVELLGVLDWKCSDPVTKLPDTQSSPYWSSTTSQTSPPLAWFVYFFDGYVFADNKTRDSYVRAVRGGS